MKSRTITQMLGGRRTLPEPNPEATKLHTHFSYEELSIQVSTDNIKDFFGDLQRCPPINIVDLTLENLGCRLR
jgi:hypothetical protein